MHLENVVDDLPLERVQPVRWRHGSPREGRGSKAGGTRAALRAVHSTQVIRHFGQVPCSSTLPQTKHVAYVPRCSRLSGSGSGSRSGSGGGAGACSGGATVAGVGSGTDDLGAAGATPFGTFAPGGNREDGEGVGRAPGRPGGRDGGRADEGFEGGFAAVGAGGGASSSFRRRRKNPMVYPTGALLYRWWDGRQAPLSGPVALAAVASPVERLKALGIQLPPPPRPARMCPSPGPGHWHGSRVRSFSRTGWSPTRVS